MEQNPDKPPRQNKIEMKNSNENKPAVKPVVLNPTLPVEPIRTLKLPSSNILTEALNQITNEEKKPQPEILAEPLIEPLVSKLDETRSLTEPILPTSFDQPVELLDDDNDSLVDWSLYNFVADPDPSLTPWPRAPTPDWSVEPSN